MTTSRPKAALDDRGSGLSAGRPIEDHPDGQVLGEVLEVVLNAGGHEHDVARLERIALGVVEEYASPP